MITDRNRFCCRILTHFFLLVLASLTVPVCAQKVLIAPVPANHIVYDPVTKKLYASVGSRGQGTLANSITRIDPQTGKIEKSVFIGSEPSQIVLSDKSKYLYVLVSDGHTIRRMDVDTMTPGMQFPVGEGVATRTIMTMPGMSEGVMAILFTPGISPAGDHLVLFVNGKAQTLTAACGNCLSYGIHPTRFYTYQNMISSWDFSTYQATPDGVMNVANTGSLMSGFVNLAGNINGLVITSGANVIDPEAQQGVGSLPDAGGDINICTDSERGLVFQILGEKENMKLRVYDILNFSLAGEVPLKDIGASGGGSQLLRWGEKGLAFLSGDRVYLLQMDLGPKLPSVDLSVQRSPISLPLPRQQQVKYTLTVTNNSTAQAHGVFLTDALPSGVEVLDVKSSQGDALMSGGVIRADLGTLAGLAKATVVVTLQVNMPVGSGFAAIVRGQEPDPTTANNLALLTLTGPTRIASP